MAEVVETPFQQDETIYIGTDWLTLKTVWFTDDAETDPFDFSTYTFSGEVLDKKGGTKLFDLSFNTPAADGIIWPQLTDTQLATIDNKNVWYFVNVVDSATLIEPYFHGYMSVSDNHKGGS